MTAIDSVRARLAAAAEGVQYVSEGEAPFTVVAQPPLPAGTNSFGVAEARRVFGIAEGTPVATRSLDDFFRPLVEDVDPADAVAQRAVPRARALRDAIRAAAPAAIAFRVGAGPEVRYIVAGVAPGAEGAVVGVETVGFES